MAIGETVYEDELPDSDGPQRFVDVGRRDIVQDDGSGGSQGFAAGRLVDISHCGIRVQLRYRTWP